MTEDYLKVGNVSMGETKWESEPSYTLHRTPRDYEEAMMHARIAEENKLRDHFAGLAMQGLVNFYDGQSMNELVARDAYAIADAMLKEREKEMTRKEKKIVTSKMPKTWHDVDKNIGKMVDEMSLEEKVDKGWANSSLLKNRKRK